MIVDFFGPADHRLFGAYHPATESRRRRGVVLLNPWGWEALRAHRTFRVLADRLARAGFDVLRFDYSCTGDSVGDSDRASPWEWVGDTERAMDELQTVAGVQRIALVGLRLGALIASEAYGRRGREVDRMVLWEPPASGRAFVESTASATESERDAFPVLQEFASGVQGMSLEAMAGFKGHLLTIGAPGESVRADAARSRTHLEPEEPGSPCWVEDRDHGAGAIPADTLNAIVEWFG